MIVLVCVVLHNFLITEYYLFPRYTGFVKESSSLDWLLRMSLTLTDESMRVDKMLSLLWWAVKLKVCDSNNMVCKQNRNPSQRLILGVFLSLSMCINETTVQKPRTTYSWITLSALSVLRVVNFEFSCNKFRIYGIQILYSSQSSLFGMCFLKISNVFSYSVISCHLVRRFIAFHHRIVYWSALTINCSIVLCSPRNHL